MGNCQSKGGPSPLFDVAFGAAGAIVASMLAPEHVKLPAMAAAGIGGYFLIGNESRYAGIGLGASAGAIGAGFISDSKMIVIAAMAIGGIAGDYVLSPLLDGVVGGLISQAVGAINKLICDIDTIGHEGQKFGKDPGVVTGGNLGVSICDSIPILGRFCQAVTHTGLDCDPSNTHGLPPETDLRSLVEVAHNQFAWPDLCKNNNNGETYGAAFCIDRLRLMAQLAPGYKGFEQQTHDTGYGERSTANSWCVWDMINQPSMYKQFAKGIEEAAKRNKDTLNAHFTPAEIAAECADLARSEGVSGDCCVSALKSIQGHQYSSYADVMDHWRQAAIQCSWKDGQKAFATRVRSIFTPRFAGISGHDFYSDIIHGMGGLVKDPEPGMLASSGLGQAAYLNTIHMLDGRSTTLSAAEAQAVGRYMCLDMNDKAQSIQGGSWSDRWIRKVDSDFIVCPNGLTTAAVQAMGGH